MRKNLGSPFNRKISAVITLCLVAFCLQAATPIARIDLQTRLLIEKIQATQDVLDAMPFPLWPGFTFENIPLVIEEADKETLLFHGPQMFPSGIDKLPEYPDVWVDFNPDFRRAAWYHQLADRHGYLNLARNQVFKVEQVLLESFVAYRQQHRFYQTVSPSVAVFNGRDMALAEWENRFLLKALQAQSPQDIKAHVTDFLTVRLERHLSLPLALRDQEIHNEINRGSSAHIRYLWHLMLLMAQLRHQLPDALAGEGQDPQALVTELEQFLERPLTPNAFLQRAHYTGWALLRLLDKLYPGWSTALERRQTPQELLQMAVAYPVIRRGQLWREMEKRHPLSASLMNFQSIKPHVFAPLTAVAPLGHIRLVLWLEDDSITLWPEQLITFSSTAYGLGAGSRLQFGQESRRGQLLGPLWFNREPGDWSRITVDLPLTQCEWWQNGKVVDMASVKPGHGEIYIQAPQVELWLENALWEQQDGQIHLMPLW